MVWLLFQLRLCGGFCPVEQNWIHPGGIAGRHGLLEQIEEPAELVLKIDPDLHAAGQLLADARDPGGSDFGERLLDGGGEVFFGHSFFMGRASGVTMTFYQGCPLCPMIQAVKVSPTACRLSADTLSGVSSRVCQYG